MTEPSDESAAADFERQYLRDEIASNKRLVFERALVIVAAGLAASLLPKDAKGIQLIGIPTIGALAFNLWFTVNRLTSNSRIVAYIQLFHESERELPWVGWENALRLHRLWLSHPERIESARSQYGAVKQYDNLSFYKPIFALHLTMALLVAALMSFVSWSSTPFSTPLGAVPPYLIPALNFGCAVALCVWAIRFRPEKLKHGIERNRLIWREVFQSYKKGELE